MPEFRILDPQPQDLTKHKGPFVLGRKTKIPVKAQAVLTEAIFPIIGTFIRGRSVLSDKTDIGVDQWSEQGVSATSNDPDWCNLFAAEEFMTEEEKYKELLRASREIYLSVSKIPKNVRDDEAFTAFAQALGNFD